MENFQLQTAQDIHMNVSVFHNWLRSLLHWWFSMGSLQLPILSLAR